MQKLTRQALIEHTLHWVWGVCILWNMEAKQYTGIKEMQDFVHRTHNAVWRYLTQRDVVDTDYSEFERDTMRLAAGVFGLHLT